MTSSIARLSSGLMCSRHRPGVAALRGSRDPSPQVESPRTRCRRSPPEARRRIVEYRASPRAGASPDRIRSQVLVAQLPAQLRIVCVEGSLDSPGALEPDAGLRARERQALLGCVQAPHVRLVQPAAAHRVHQRIDHISRVPHQEDKTSPRKQRHDQVRTVGAVRLLDDHGRVGERMLAFGALDLGREAGQDQAPQFGPPGALVLGCEEVVRIGSACLVQGRCRAAARIIRIEPDGHEWDQVLGQVRLVDRHRLGLQPHERVPKPSLEGRSPAGS